MTCFWDGILRSLDDNDFKDFEMEKPINIIHLVDFLKKYNTYTLNVEWNNEVLTDLQIHENFIAIDEFDLDTINDGYYCSCFDPFLFLISELFKLRIKHSYNATPIIYCHKSYKKTVNYNSNSCHFNYF
jgi:hypothetical protein